MPDAPIGELPDFDEQVRLMFDLIVLAYQANVTRVASYIMVGEGTNRTYNHIGVSDAFHPLSHHANDMERLLKLVKIQRYHVERFADFVAKIATIPDGDGTLLDNSLFMYGSNMSNSDRHNNYPLPTSWLAAPAARSKAVSTSCCPSTRRLRICTSRCSTRRGSSSRACGQHGRDRRRLTSSARRSGSSATSRRAVLQGIAGGVAGLCVPPMRERRLRAPRRVVRRA